MSYRIMTAAYHRNGVSGEGFYVGIIQGTGDGGDGRFLCIDFTGHTAAEAGYTPEEVEQRDVDPNGNFDRSRFAVLRMDELCEGNIGMHPITDPKGRAQKGTGGNAWHGDCFSHLREPIRDWVEAGRLAQQEKARKANEKKGART